MREGDKSMKIAVIGAGAMGSIYGGRLSVHHEVYLVDTNQLIVDKINDGGLKLQEDGQDMLFWPTAVTSTEGLPKMDLVILFVKALFSRAALSQHAGIIGPDTYVLTLQNGSGHEDILTEFVDVDHIMIGTTEDNGAVLEAGYVRHGGEGKTNVGMLVEDQGGMLPKIKEAFDCCGFHVLVHDNIQALIWDKLMTNVSLSVVTGILQVKMGYIAANEYAWNLTECLIREAVAVAAGLGMIFDEEDVISKVRTTSMDNPEGITSICSDIQAGRRTEVDTISGSVVRAARKCGVSAPAHEMVVNVIHGLEGRGLFQ